MANVKINLVSMEVRTLVQFNSISWLAPTCINFVLTESAVITGKYQTKVLAVRTKAIARGPYIKDQGLIFPSNDQAVEVNKKFIKWFF